MEPPLIVLRTALERLAIEAALLEWHLAQHTADERTSRGQIVCVRDPAGSALARRLHLPRHKAAAP
jgi:hypothetical protein